MSSVHHAPAGRTSTVNHEKPEGPPITADPTTFEDPVTRAQWLEKVLVLTFEMDPQDARLVSGLVIEHFGDKDEVLDDEIPNDVRSVFYTLEAKRILTFRRIEYENEDGATLRGFYWRFHSEWEPPEDVLNDESEANVYEKLPEDCWDRTAAS